MKPHTTKPGDLVRICRDGRTPETTTLSPLEWTVSHVWPDGMIQVNHHGMVRIVSSWIRCK